MALETRLAVGRSRPAALVPPLRGRDFTAAAYRHAATPWNAAHVAAGQEPVLVALCEDGLLEDLAGFGLSAYVGVPPGQAGMELQRLTAPARWHVRGPVAGHSAEASLGGAGAGAALPRRCSTWRRATGITRAQRPGAWDRQVTGTMSGTTAPLPGCHRRGDSGRALWPPLAARRLGSADRHRSPRRPAASLGRQEEDRPREEAPSPDPEKRKPGTKRGKRGKRDLIPGTLGTLPGQEADDGERRARDPAGDSDGDLVAAAPPSEVASWRVRHQNELRAGR